MRGHQVLSSGPQRMKRTKKRLDRAVHALAAAAALLLLPGASLEVQVHGAQDARKTDASRARPNYVEANPFGVQFHDVTKQAGIHFHHERAASGQKLYLETMGAGVAWIDYNRDGFLDAFFVNSGYTTFFHPEKPPQPALYRNNGDGTFTDVTQVAGIRTDGTFFFGVAVADFDNDGYPDIYMTGYRHSVLYHNNGDGTFTDVTAKAGVGDDSAWATAAGWFDYDRDGKLDLLVTNYVQFDTDHPVSCGINKPGYRAYCHPDSFSGSSPRLYHNNGNGTFSDVTKSSGLDNRDGTFRDATYSSGAGFSEDGKAEAGMSADAADVRNNGLYDLFVSHLDFQLNRYYRNNGDGTFADATISSGLGQTNYLNSSFGARFLDFD